MSENEEDFAAMFEASIKTRRLEPGQAVEGTIVAIGDEVAFVNVGAKGEATIALDELRDEDGALEVGVGDRIQATLASTTGGLTLSRKLQRGPPPPVSWRMRSGRACPSKARSTVR